MANRQRDRETERERERHEEEGEGEREREREREGRMMLRRAAAARGFATGSVIMRNGGNARLTSGFSSSCTPSAPSTSAAVPLRLSVRNASRRGPRSVEERVIDEIERMRAAGASTSKSRPHTDTHMDAKMSSFYHFSELPDPEAFASDLKERCAAQSVLGRVLVAREGINGAVVGAPQSVDEVMTWMQSVDALRGLRYRTCSVARPGMDRSPFHRLQVRIKKEIITMPS